MNKKIQKTRHLPMLKGLMDRYDYSISRSIKLHQCERSSSIGKTTFSNSKSFLQHELSPNQYHPQLDAMKVQRSSFISRTGREDDLYILNGIDKSLLDERYIKQLSRCGSNKNTPLNSQTNSLTKSSINSKSTTSLDPKQIKEKYQIRSPQKYLTLKELANKHHIVDTNFTQQDQKEIEEANNRQKEEHTRKILELVQYEKSDMENMLSRSNTNKSKLPCLKK